MTGSHETNLLATKVRTFFNIKSDAYTRLQDIDRAKPLKMGSGDRNISHESPGKWHVDPTMFLGPE